MRFFYHKIRSLLGNIAAKTGSKNMLCNLIPHEEVCLKQNKTKTKTPFYLHYTLGIFMFHALKFHLPSSLFRLADCILEGKQLFPC